MNVGIALSNMEYFSTTSFEISDADKVAEFELLSNRIAMVSR